MPSAACVGAGGAGGNSPARGTFAVRPATRGFPSAWDLPIENGMQDPDKLRCSSRIASALLDALSATGDVAGLGRARRVYAQESVNVRAAGSWVSRRTIDSAFRALGSDRSFARRVGYTLVASDRIGFSFFVGGVATIEKAYRRCDRLLAREDREGHFQTIEVADGTARIAYHPGQGSGSREGETRHTGWNPSFCGVRQGMLEALPLSFGLLPATVEESQCVGDGASHCCFEVRFEGQTNKCALLGLSSGAALAVASCALLLGELPLWVQGVMVAGVALLCAAVGRSVDLAKQLRAVAGARRGHLALLEQADRTLAEKMDELAKVGSHLEDTRGERTDRLRALLEQRSEDERAQSHDAEQLEGGSTPSPGTAAQAEYAQQGAHAAQQIYDALGPLQRGLDDAHSLLRDQGREPAAAIAETLATLRLCVDETRRIGSVGATLAKAGSRPGRPHEPIQLAEVVSRAADCVRPHLEPEQQLVLDFENELPLVRCEPFQMEQVAYQLLKNAVDASCPDGMIRVELLDTPGGIELSIEDHGAGIPEEVVDQVFDPFADDNPVGSEGGLGLAICYRIVVEHGGEMRLSSDLGGGTKVTVVLTPDHPDPETGEIPV